MEEILSFKSWRYFRRRFSSREATKTFRMFFFLVKMAEKHAGASLDLNMTLLCSNGNGNDTKSSVYVDCLRILCLISTLIIQWT